MKHAYFALLCASLATPVAATDAPLRDGWLGKWRGAGLVATTRFDADQRLRCRLEISEPTTDITLFSGRCATSASQRRFSFEIAADAAGNLWATALNLPTGEVLPPAPVTWDAATLTIAVGDDAAITLTQGDDGLALNLTGRDDGHDYHGQAQLRAVQPAS